DYIAKPIDRELLGTMLGRWLVHTSSRERPSPTLIHTRTDLDAAALRRIADAATAELPRLLVAIQTQLAVNDLRRVAAHAHTLRGAAANLGAERLQQLAATLEHQALSQDAESVQVLWSDLAAATASLVSELRAV
ncbi:MAG: Hpt domain-containing protein, partial [Actinomycetota bacterium]|nr:Hpt domain-containing protein [Actinomycetota bacterium]